MPVDIADSVAVRAGVSRVTAELGPPDILVNNAGIDVVELFMDSAEKPWDKIIAVNLRGTITVTRAVLDAMIERGVIKRRLIVIRPLAELYPEKLQAEHGGGTARSFPLVCRELVPKHGRSRPIRKAILNELNPLCCQFDLLEDDAGDIAGGPCKACHVASGERIVVDGNHHYRHRPRNRKRRLQADFRANSKNDVGRTRCELPVDDFVLVCARSLQKIKGKILSLQISELPHAPFESDPLR